MIRIHFERDGSDGGVMAFPAFALDFVVSSNPLGLLDGEAGELVQALTQEGGGAQRQWTHCFVLLRSVTGAMPVYSETSMALWKRSLDPVWHEVVGVVEDVRGRDLAQEPRVQTYMTFGAPPFGGIPSLVLNVRTELGPGALGQAVTDVVRSVDPEIPLGPVRSMEEVVAASIERERLLSVLLAIFAGVALILGAVGVYGVVSYSVGRRTREIGLRIAVGARPGSVLGLVVRQGTAMGLLGVAIGITGSLAAGRAMEGFLFGVSATDVPSLAAVSAVVLGVAALASFLPARRAAHVDPLTALRG